MGNFNSGRSTSRRTTNDMRRLDVRKLQRLGHLEAGNSVSWQWKSGATVTHSAQIQAFDQHISITHACTRVAGELAQARYDIALEQTPCHLGGHRLWWRCPVPTCTRRAAILYGGNGAVFACRSCYNLNYRSQRETPADRRIRHLDKLRDRLGWQPGFLNGNGFKPPRMHWTTYWSLQRQHDDLVQLIAGDIRKKFRMK